MERDNESAQLIPKKGEEYLREAGKIEDYPSPAEDAEVEKVEKKDENKGITDKRNDTEGY